MKGSKKASSDSTSVNKTACEIPFFRSLQKLRKTIDRSEFLLAAYEPGPICI